MMKKTAILLSVILFNFLNIANATAIVANPGYRVLGGNKANSDYPIAPNPTMTPGALCQSADEYRYPEKIKYCNRGVSTDLKYQIIADYDRQLGYHISQMTRAQFKIDHYIPLCAGGSNEPINLWPQHESVFTVTDAMEAKICEKMSQGKLKQVDAVKIVRSGKNDLATIPKIMQYLNSLK